MTCVVGVFLGLALLTVVDRPAAADSSSPLLAAYYDRQMAIVDDAVYAWKGTEKPARVPIEAVQVGVGRDSYYALTVTGELLGFGDDPARHKTLMTGVAKFAAGRSGILAIKSDRTLWWIKGTGGDRQKIADDVGTAAVGDGANYYITRSGALFVRGKAHRGQYGDGRLTATKDFVQTASDAVRVRAHTGHAILLKKNGDVMGTGGNIYGPLGRHGLGDKAVRWSLIMSDARAIATGSSHSLAIRQDGGLVAWGWGYNPEPQSVMPGVVAVAAGTETTIALKNDGTLWQWDRGEQPRRVQLDASRP
jgi:alpha-tubulin suppressor-like RCC1 family protein